MTDREFLAGGGDQGNGSALLHVPARTFIDGIGKAVMCSAASYHRPLPRRFVWHHVLPLACGGTTVAGNLVQLCDSCHYSTHDLLWLLANNQAISGPVNRGQMACAQAGYDAAKAAGTLGKVPREA